MHLLLVEDDEVLADGLAAALRQNTFEVDVVRDGITANDILLKSSKSALYNLILLDLTLPGMDGSEVLRRLRERDDQTPVLVLTARSNLQDRVLGLDSGADDYVTKPFDLPELEARIRALARRKNPPSIPTDGEVGIDVIKRTLIIRDERIDLSGRETEIMRLLVDNLNTVISRERMISRLSSNDEELGQNALEVYIHRLRRKLEGTGLELKTIRGVGYLLAHLT